MHRAQTLGYGAKRPSSDRSQLPPGGRKSYYPQAPLTAQRTSPAAPCRPVWRSPSCAVKNLRETEQIRAMRRRQTTRGSPPGHDRRSQHCGSRTMRMAETPTKSHEKLCFARAPWPSRRVAKNSTQEKARSHSAGLRVPTLSATEPTLSATQIAGRLTCQADLKSAPNFSYPTDCVKRLST